ncbi:hypothetical protein AU476_36025 [Cupriavidus sp. UYMSc13B]|nr:hypothetical protein AU476_36025 [Cupriavidus sp. UYMSc13B]
MLVVYLLKTFLTEAEFRDWGWRIPFIVSLVMLVISVYIRGKPCRLTPMGSCPGRVRQPRSCRTRPRAQTRPSH